jgi:hypothetical protein
MRTYSIVKKKKRNKQLKQYYILRELKYNQHQFKTQIVDKIINKEAHNNGIKTLTFLVTAIIGISLGILIFKITH